MSDDYRFVKTGGIKLKGDKKALFSVDKKKKSKKNAEKIESSPDMLSHGGWWSILEDVDLKGGISIAIECESRPHCYLSALDTGKFTIGGPHKEGEEPSPEEIFAVVKTPDESKISIKTGYGKFIGVASDGELIATAEAIGSRERFQPVFEKDKSALQSVSHGLFLSTETNADGHVYVASKQAKDAEMILIRTNAVKVGPVDWRTEDDKKSAGACETAYVKMYQHSKVDLKGRHISVDVNDKKGVKRAQNSGDLHEHLLNKRVKCKSDRYC